MKETNHDYQNCLVDNFFDANCKNFFKSWEEFKYCFAGGFNYDGTKYDDRYAFVFRYDINKREDDTYLLELCIMLQRKGIYYRVHIYNITQKELDGEVKDWLKDRYAYLKKLWKEVE